MNFFDDIKSIIKKVKEEEFEKFAEKLCKIKSEERDKKIDKLLDPK